MFDVHISKNSLFSSQDHGRLPDVHKSKRRSQDHGRLPAVHARNHHVWTPFEAIALPFSQENKNNLGILGRTHRTKTTDA